MRILHLILATLSLAPVMAANAVDQIIDSETGPLRVATLTTGLSHPWGMTFLPDGSMLVTERAGRLRRVNADGQLDPTPIGGLPEIRAQGQGGLLDVALHPKFAANRLVYIAFSEPGSGGVGTAVARGYLHGSTLEDTQVIFRLLPKSGTGHHFGARLVFDRDGYLFITLGDRGERARAQDIDDHAGSLIRIHDDGRVPADNPFVGRADARPEIFSYGHRNQQGAALNPWTGAVWTHEHGPQGGDEINIPRAGANHGWPVITYGVEYVSARRIGEGTHKAGMAQPIHSWVPSIAPSGMAFYTGHEFSAWQGNLLVGSLKFGLLVRLALDGDKVVHEERLLNGHFGRIRDVRQGPDGAVYLLTDEDAGRILRLSREE